MNNFSLPLIDDQPVVHVSALLHAFVSLITPKFQIQPTDIPTASSFDEEALPVSSRLCQWKVPRKRKESTMRMERHLL